MATMQTDPDLPPPRLGDCLPWRAIACALLLVAFAVFVLG